MKLDIITTQLKIGKFVMICNQSYTNNKKEHFLFKIYSEEELQKYKNEYLINSDNIHPINYLYKKDLNLEC